MSSKTANIKGDSYWRSGSMIEKNISGTKEEGHRIAQEWAKEIHKSQIAKGLRPADGESEEEEVEEEVKEDPKQISIVFLDFKI
tara:strand:- start:873 stop:1124 length:252 start_codon:yes stop_codon:yes gene_type:complete